MSQIGGMVDPIKLWGKYGQQLKLRFSKDRSIKGNITELPSEFIYQNNLPYSDWIIRSYIRGGIKLFEDIRSRVHPALDRYKELLKKKSISEKIATEVKKNEPWNTNPISDINRFCGIIGCQHSSGKWVVPGLESFISQYDHLLGPDGANAEVAKSVPIYEDELCRIYHPTTEQESCRIGRGTQWCTAAKEGNMFNQYNSNGPMYIIVPQREHRQYPQEKYQIHQATGQFMNDQDEPVSFGELLGRFPGISTVIPPLAVMTLRGETVLVYIDGGDGDHYSHKFLFYCPRSKRSIDLQDTGLIKKGQSLYKIGDKTYLYEGDDRFIELMQIGEIAGTDIYTTPIIIDDGDGDQYNAPSRKLLFYCPRSKRLMDVQDTGLIKKGQSLYKIGDKAYLYEGDDRFIELKKMGEISGTDIYIAATITDNEGEDNYKLVFYNNTKEVEPIKLGFILGNYYKISEQLYYYWETDYGDAFKVINTGIPQPIIIDNRPANYYRINGIGLMFHMLDTDEYMTDHHVISQGLLKPVFGNFYLINDEVFFYSGSEFNSMWDGKDGNLVAWPGWKDILSLEGLSLLNDIIAGKPDSFEILDSWNLVTGNGSERIDYLCHTKLNVIMYIYHGKVYHMDHPPTQLIKDLHKEIKSKPNVYEIMDNGDINGAMIITDGRLWITWNSDLMFIDATIEKYRRQEAIKLYKEPDN